MDLAKEEGNIIILIKYNCSKMYLYGEEVKLDSPHLFCCLYCLIVIKVHHLVSF